MATETELRDGLAYVAAELEHIDSEAGDAALDTDTQARFDEGVAYVTETREAIDRLVARAAQVEAVRAAAAVPGATQRGDSGPTTRSAPNVNLNRSPFDETRDGYADLSNEELRGRAKAAIAEHTDYEGVTDEVREGLTQTVERYTKGSKTGREVARHILMTGSEEYVRHFEDFLMNPLAGPPREMFRTAMSTTAGNGGVLIPHFLDPTVNLTNTGTNNVIREVSHIVQLTGSNKWEGVTSAGVTAEWIAEATQVADGSPTFVGPTITPSKADAYIQASLEVIQDTGFSEVTRLIMDAKDRLEESAFTTGTGSGQPFGLITRLSGTGPSFAGTSGAAGAADFVIGDVYGVKNGLTPRFRRGSGGSRKAAWMASPAIYDKVRQMGNATAGTNNANFWVDLGAAIPSTLLGYEAYEDESMRSTITSGSNDDVLLFGDFANYYIVDRIGMELAYNPMVISTSNNRPTGEVGWVAFWRTGADVITSNAFRLLRL